MDYNSILSIFKTKDPKIISKKREENDLNVGNNMYRVL